MNDSLGDDVSVVLIIDYLKSTFGITDYERKKSTAEFPTEESRNHELHSKGLVWTYEVCSAPVTVSSLQSVHGPGSLFTTLQASPSLLPTEKRI